ncbi:AraC family transcriptional regulator [Leuconostoc falkenbergense]|uniref:AraC family transcriptional regulator n=1 Tax=Leuconostoc falkenbergense TaxID=2766470 RepID=UPI0024A946E4|nr:AraC family transcriptional regulator [Leuconostoc falkenbergense]MDI6553318.1 AraC family transcriptional regulator [Leuconostoc falkenbergense]
MTDLQRLNQAINFLEAHLTDDIDYDKVAKITLTSKYHFSRMFTFLSGMTLTEYLRNRRLSLAAQDLIHEKVTILTIATRYGYDSADSFSRAFKQFHSFLPSKIGKHLHEIKSFSKITFQLTIKGGSTMNYRLVTQKPKFMLAGFQKEVPLIAKGINYDVQSMAIEFMTPEAIVDLKSISNIEPSGIISASTNFTDDGNLEHWIGVATTKTQQKYDQLIINNDSWVVFEAVGKFPQALQEVWTSIFSEWFPDSSYELDDGPILVWYGGQDMSVENYKTEIWLPVRLRD